MTDRSSFAGQLDDALARKGTTITLRRLTTLPGPVPSVNPPTINTPLVNGAVLAGANRLSLRCVAAQGRFEPGDTLTINGVTITVTARTLSNPVVGIGAGFTNVPVSGVTAGIPDGTPAVPTFAADLVLPALIGGFSVRLIDGDRIQARDLSVKISAFLVPDVQTTWRIRLGTRELSIEQAVPSYVRGEIVGWDIQAR